jgi:DNA-directed RNA polymerase specialized sigma24 family protein
MNGEEADEEQLPISVVREIVAALLIMPAEIRNAVCWRYAGFEYRDVAKVQNCTIAAVEVRHRRALRRWPALKALFPEKVARQAKRAESGKRDREDSGPLTMGGSQT